MAKHYPSLKRSDLVIAEIQQTPGEETLWIMKTLQIAVRKCLERKPRLGQYAVIWKDGRPQQLMPHSTESMS